MRSSIRCIYVCEGVRIPGSAGKEIQPTAGRMTGEVEANSAAAQIVAVGNISSVGHVLHLRRT